MTSESSEKVPVESGVDSQELRSRHDALLAAVDRGVCYLGSDGCIASANEAFAEMVGRSVVDVQGERLATFFASDEGENGDARGVDDAAARLADADSNSNADQTTLDGTLRADERPVTVRLRRVGASGAGDAAVVAVVSERDTGGDATPDGEETRPSIEANGATGINDVERQFESLVDTVEEYAIFVLDPDGYVASWNEGARQIKGYDREEILGEHYATFFTEADAESGVPEQYLSEARERGSVDIEGWRVRKDGSQFWANATLTAIRDDDGEFVGYTKVTRDMSERRERRQQIREDRDLLYRVLETSPVGITVIAEDGSVVHSNADEQPALAGMTDDSRVGDFDVYDADGEFVPPAERPYVEVFETGDPVEDWLGQVDAEEGRRWVNVNAAPLTDASGDVKRVVVTTEDVTEFKEQEAKLERQRDELVEEVTEMFERISDAFFGLDRSWEFTYVNEQAEELLGKSAEELEGEYVWNLFDEDSAEQFREQYEYAMDNQEPVDFEAYYEEPLDRWFHVSAYPSETGLSVYFRDVTERKEYERELAESEERYRTLVENLPDGAVTVTDTDLRYTLAGGGAFDNIHLTPDDFVGQSVYDVFEEDAELYERALDGQHVSREIEFDDRVYESQTRPIRGDDGEIVAAMNLLVDTTERKEHERELEQYHALTQAVNDVIVTVDASSTIQSVNPAVEDMFGYDPDELVGESLTALIPERFREPHLDAVREYVETGERHLDWDYVELSGLHRSGEEVPLAISFSEVEYEGERLFTGVIRDVTERKEYERELTESEERYRTLVENLPGGTVNVFDEDLRYTLAGGEVLDDLGLSSADLVGNTLYDVFPDMADELEPAYRAALAGEHRMVETEYRGRTYELHLRPVRDDAGEVVAGLNLVLDVTERHEYERTLAALNEATHAFPRAETRVDVAEQLVDVTTDVLGLSGVTVYLHDPKAGVLYDAAHSEDMMEVYGSLPTVTDDPSSSITADAFAGGQTRVYEDITESDLMANPEAAARRSLFVPLDHHGVLIISDTEVGAFEERTVELAELVGANGTSALDMVEREETLRANERELRRYEQIVETVWDGVYALDDKGRFVLANDALLELTGYDRDELIGRPATDLYSDDIKVKAERMAAEVERGEREVGVLELDLVTKGGDTVPVEVRFGPYQYDEDSTGRTGVVRNITDRRQREKELQTRIRQQEVITELGHYAIRAGEFDDILQRATELVSETLGTDYCKVLDLDDEHNELLLRAGVGWKPGLRGEATVRADTNSQAGYTLLTDGPVVVDDLDTESRFTGPDLLFDHDVVSGISTIIGSHDDPWGILGTHDTEDKGFTDNDVAFVQSVATILTNAVERERQERELEHQREQLAALNQLNRVVQGINRAVVEKSSREEIEKLVCDRLADTYRFAWVGEVGRGNREVMVRTEAGVENYLSEITLDLDDEVASQGPTATAIRTREMQVARNIPENPDYAWQDHAESHNYRSSAAIPITHEGSLYGVLNIYSERPDAFDGQEGAVLSQLGDIVGHAINSVERKQALMSDEMVELEFYLPNVSDSVGVPADQLDGEIRFDRTIPTGDGEYLVYGSMTTDARDMMDTLREALPHFGDLRVLSGDDDEVTFEIKLTDPPAISVVADHGGRVVSATLAGGDYEMRVHLPQTADVREVVTALQEKYPDVELVAQRRTTKSDTGRESGPTTLTADLTDRQRAVLEAAFRSGFFEWPRESTGEDIADSVGITASTLHQHLRAAERKLVDSYLDG